MKSAIAVVAMAAFCAFAAAAPFGSQSHPNRLHSSEALVEIRPDADLNYAWLDGERVPGLQAEVVLAGGPAPSALEKIIVPLLFGCGALLAMGSVYLITYRNLRSRPGRRKRLEYSTRTMSSLT